MGLKTQNFHHFRAKSQTNIVVCEDVSAV